MAKTFVSPDHLPDGQSEVHAEKSRHRFPAPELDRTQAVRQHMFVCTEAYDPGVERPANAATTFPKVRETQGPPATMAVCIDGIGPPIESFQQSSGWHPFEPQIPTFRFEQKPRQ